MNPPPIPKRGMGCFTKLLIAIGVLLVLLFSLLVGSAYVAIQNLKPYLSDTAVSLPHKEMPAAQIEALQERVKALQTAQEKGKSVQVVLTQPELNALIASEPSVRDHLYIRLDGNRAYVYCTIPMNSIPVLSWFASNKHVNGVVDCSPRVTRDTLLLDIQRVWLNNSKLPEEGVKQFSRDLDKRLAERGTSTNEDLEVALRNVSELSLIGSTVIIETGGHGRMTGEPLAP